MTSGRLRPEGLEKLVAAGDLEGIANAAESMKEAERAELSETAAGLYEPLAGWLERGGGRDLALVERLGELLDGREPAPLMALYQAAEIGALAFCSWPTLRGVERRVLRWDSVGHDSFVLKVLMDRRPEWLAAWLDQHLEFPIDISWDVLRPLVREGLYPKPSHERYVIVMTSCLNFYDERTEAVTPLSQTLREDRGLLEDEVWRLFEVETPALAEEWDEYGCPRPEGYETWRMALCDLAATGDLDRQRLLRASLEGMSRGFENDNMLGYLKLHEELGPTAEERAACQQAYMGLLSNSPTRVVNFALKAIRVVAKKGLLDEKTFLTSAGPALISRTKGHPKTAMAVLEAAVKHKPAIRPDAALLLTEALTHEAPDVQQRAIDLLEKWAESGDAALAQALSERLDDVAPSQRPHVEALLERLGGVAAPEPEPAPAGTEGREQVLRRVDALSPEVRRIAGVDDAVAALDDGTLPPLEFSLLDAAVLSDVEPITPIAEIDELIEAVAHAVETVDSADEVERIWDGISRLCGERPDDFERKTEPLVKRIEDLLESRQAWHGLLSFALPRGPSRLLLAWLRPERPIPDGLPLTRDCSGSQFLDGRLEEIARRAERRQPCPLLAAPTHAHGWLDPRVFVERLVAAGEIDLNARQFDLAQALIRLVPDGRSQALEDASALPGDLGRVVRWALGGSEAPTKEEEAHATLWLAASRARSPQRELQELAGWDIEKPNPGAIPPRITRARLEARDEDLMEYVRQRLQRMEEDEDYDPTRWHFPDGDAVIPRLLRVSNLPSPKEWRPVALHACDCWLLGSGTAWYIDWLGTLWPQNDDRFFTSGVLALNARLDSNASTLSPNHVFLHPLLQRDLPWGEIARVAALLGLAGRDADARGYAIDALAEAVADGRVHPEELGEALILLLRVPAIKLNRITEGMQEVARISDVHAFVIAQVLAFWLRHQDTLPKGAHHALEPLLELLTQCGIPLDDKARKPLEGLKGSSKTAKLAKRLLAHSPPDPERRREQFVLTLLEARLERAERWQGA